MTLMADTLPYEESYDELWQATVDGQVRIPMAAERIAQLAALELAQATKIELVKVRVLHAKTIVAVVQGTPDQEDSES